MRCVTPREISRWLETANQFEDPYLGESEPRLRLQFHCPDRYKSVEHFAHVFAEDIVATGDLLVVISDSEPSEPSQIAIIDAIRHSIGESRPIRDAPGFIVERKELEKAIGLFALTSCFMWKSYLYTDHDRIVLYNWEGEIWDFWTDSESSYNLMAEMIKHWELKIARSE